MTRCKAPQLDLFDVGERQAVDIPSFPIRSRKKICTPDVPGSGPDGETCRTCLHLARNQMAKTYLKCGLMRSFWTRGPGTDVKAGWPACSKWTRKE